MINEKTEQLIFEYIDGELNSKEETELFAILSKDENARKFFSETIALQKKILQTSENFPQNLEAKITRNIQSQDFLSQKENLTKWIKRNFVYLLAAAMLLFGIFTFSMLNKYNSEIKKMKTEIRQQTETISAFLNSYPEIKVTANENSFNNKSKVKL